MSAPKPYRLIRTEKFERSLDKVATAAYRKDTRGREAFIGEVDKILGVLKLDPRHRSPLLRTDPEPIHRNHLPLGWELRKARFKLPKREGALGEGRLMYLVSDDKTEIRVFWIYTHADFQKRPADKAIADEIRDALASQTPAEGEGSA